MVQRVVQCAAMRAGATGGGNACVWQSQLDVSRDSRAIRRRGGGGTTARRLRNVGGWQAGVSAGVQVAAYCASKALCKCLQELYYVVGVWVFSACIDKGTQRRADAVFGNAQVGSIARQDRPASNCDSLPQRWGSSRRMTRLQPWKPAFARRKLGHRGALGAGSKNAISQHHRSRC